MLLIYETSVTSHGDFDGILEPRAGIEMLCLDDEDAMEIVSGSDVRKRRDIVLLVSVRKRSLLAQLGVYPTLQLNDAPYNYRAQALLSAKLDHYLNRDGFLLPFNAIASHPTVPDTFFLKSDSGSKLLPGQIVRKNDMFTVEQTYRFDRHALCLIAPVSSIICEARYWVGVNDFGDAAIIARAPYHHNDQPAPDAQSLDLIERQASARVNEVCSRLQSCSVMVVDLALMADQSVKIVEVNSVNTSGTYGATESVVAGIACFLQSFDKSGDNGHNVAKEGKKPNALDL